MKALAIFHDHGSAAICRFLKPGFRHCFVCLAADDAWILFDPRAGVPVLEIVADVDFDLAGFYQSRGFTVVETIRRNTEGGFPLMVATCVGVAKRMLGIRSPLVQTPWRLYRHLTEKKAETGGPGVRARCAPGKGIYIGFGSIPVDRSLSRPP